MWSYVLPTGAQVKSVVIGPGDPSVAATSAFFQFDNLSFTGNVNTTTTINNALTTTTGTSTSVTPTTINGTLAVALGANEVVEVFRNDVSIGNATVTGTTWKIVDSTLSTVQVDLYEARVKNTSTSAVVTDSNDYVINPLTLSITAAQADAPMSDSFATSTTTADVASVSTALWNISSTENVRWVSAPSGTNYSPNTSSIMVMHGTKNASGNVVDTFQLKGGATFSGINFKTGYADAVSAPNTPVDVKFYDSSNTLLSTQQFTFSGKTLYSPFTFTSSAFTGQARYFTLTTAFNNSFAIDDLNYTTSAGATSFSIASGGTMVDTTPVLNGTIPRVLAAGETVDIFLDGATTPVGSATIAVGDTAWTWTQPTALTVGTHSYVAKIMSGGAYIGSSSAFSVVVAATPLVLDLNGDGVKTVGMQAGALFDLNADGQLDNVGWASPKDGLLAIDLNNDGMINNGRELFGQFMFKQDGSLARDGFDALRDYDANHDGVIDQQDVVYNKLQVWVDANSDGITDQGELQSLGALGINSIGLAAAYQYIDQNGNILGDKASYTTNSGQSLDVVDVWFQSKQVQLIQGTTGDDVLQGTAGDDWLLAQGGADQINAGAGNDVVVINADNVQPLAAADSGSHLDGGEGTNVLKLSGADIVLDLTSVTVAGNLSHFSQLDLSGTGANSVVLNLSDVLQITPDSSLKLIGDADDTVHANLANDWLDSGALINDAGHSFAVYNAADGGVGQLLIDQQMLNAGHVS